MIDRRRLLQSGLVAGAALGAGLGRGSAVAQQPVPPVATTTSRFRHGVASGDPLHDRVVLWTRVTPDGAPDDPAAGAGSEGDTPAVDVTWRVARDLGLIDVVASGATTADTSRDLTVKVDASGLPSNSWLYYDFAVGDDRSPVGRTRTAPAPDDPADRLRIAVVTCANYRKGHFTVYGGVHARPDLDLVVHCGDYIYESDGEGDLGRPMFPAREITTLTDYRQRYGLYRTDPDLQRMHQLFPMIAVWDDHESVNDSSRDGSPDHDEASQGPYADRIAVSQRVWDEWLPVRLPDTTDPTRIWRQLPWGDLLDIVAIDTRLERDEQATFQDAVTITEPATNDPDRVIWSDDQRDFVHRALADAQSRGATWKLLINQVMLMPWNAGGLPQGPLADLPTPIRSGGNALNADQWDGYTAERNRLFDAIEASGVTDLVVVTGDVHTSFAGDLTRDPYDPTVYDPTGLLGPTNPGVEFVTPAVSSGTLAEDVPDANALRAVEAAILAGNPHMRFNEQEHRGYWVLDLTPERCQGELFLVETVEEPTSAETFATAWQTRVGTNRLVPADGPLAPPDVAAVPDMMTTAPSAPASPVDPVADPATTSSTAPAPVPTQRLPATGAGLGATAIVAALAVRRRSTSDS